MNITQLDSLKQDLQNTIDNAKTTLDNARKIIIYGCGNLLPETIQFIKSTGNSHKISALLDDNPAKQDVMVLGLTAAKPQNHIIEKADCLVFTFPLPQTPHTKFGLAQQTEIIDAYRLSYALGVCQNNLNNICWTITSACNSRCKICGYWRSQPQHLDINAIARTVNDLPETNHSLSGGEFFCHPQWRDLLEKIPTRDNILLFTNGLSPELAWQAHDDFGINRFSISLDGTKQTYHNVRGVDGFDTVIKTIKGLKSRPGISVNVPMVINEHTTLEDFHTVENLCEQLGLYFAVIVYFQWKQFDNLPSADSTAQKLPQFEKAVAKSKVIGGLDRKFLATYSDWYNGKLDLPCTGGFTSLFISQTGNVFWCPQKTDSKNAIGNINEKPLHRIIHSKRFHEIAHKMYPCNECWGIMWRRFDLMSHQQQNALTSASNT